MKHKFSTKKFEQGQGLVEYVLIFSLVAVASIGALMAFGPQIKVIAAGMIGATDGDFSVQDGQLIIEGISSTLTPTGSPAPTDTPTATASATPTESPTPTNSPTPTDTATPTNTPTATASATHTYTPTPTKTNTPTATNTPLPTNTPTSTYTATATATNTPTPTLTPAPEWTQCAVQNGYCSFTGTASVRYGKSSTWVTQIHTDGVACTNAVFGNPISGTKTCEIYR